MNDQRHHRFLADLCFVITLLVAVFAPIVGLTLLGVRAGWGLSLYDAGVWAPLGVAVFGPLMGYQAKLPLPADFFTLCGLPVLSWGLSALILRLRLDLEERFGARRISRALIFGLIWLRRLILDGMILLYAVTLAAASPQLALLSGWALTLCVMLVLNHSAKAAKLEAQVIAGLLLTEQLIWPWVLWLLAR